MGSGSHNDLKFSNPGGGISGEQGSACVMVEGGLNSGCCNGPSAPLSDDGGKPGAASVPVSITFNAGVDPAASSGIKVTALVADASSKKCVDSADRVRGGSGNHEDLKFSNPGGAISGEQGSASIVGEGGLGTGSCNDPSASLFNADGTPGVVSVSPSVASHAAGDPAASTDVTATASVSAASGKTYVVSAGGGGGGGSCAVSEFSHPGGAVSREEGGCGCCCGNKLSGPPSNGDVGGAGAVCGSASIDSGAGGGPAASSDAIATASAEDASGKAPEVGAGGVGGGDGGGASSGEASAIWGEGGGDATAAVASGETSTASAGGGGEVEVGSSEEAASSATDAEVANSRGESEGGGPAPSGVPSIGGGSRSSAPSDFAVACPGDGGGVRVA